MEIAELAALAKESFLDPWSAETFRHEISLPFSYVLMARTSSSPPNRLVGYLLYWLVADEMQIHSLAINSDYRRRGIASRLVRTAIERAARQEVRKVFLEVRRSNLAARKFYEKIGLSVVGMRQGYYHDTKEDALIMAANVDEIRI
jgi:ribosomal-protein-alanine N-acetyltransferase